MIDRRSRDSFALPGSTTERSVTIGISRSTPSSVAFSTSQSNRSPLGTADASVSGKGGRRSGSGVPTAVSSTQSSPTAITSDASRVTSAVKDLDEVAHAEPADAAQMPGLAGSQAQPAVERRIGAIKPSGHASSPGLAKD